jgi:hypothetical protein
MPQHYPGGQPDFMSDIDRIFARTKTAAHRGGLGSIGGGELGPIGTGGYNPNAMMQRYAQLEQEGRLFDPNTGQPMMPLPHDYIQQRGESELFNLQETLGRYGDDPLTQALSPFATVGVGALQGIEALAKENVTLGRWALPGWMPGSLEGDTWKDVQEAERQDPLPWYVQLAAELALDPTTYSPQMLIKMASKTPKGIAALTRLFGKGGGVTAMDDPLTGALAQLGDITVAPAAPVVREAAEEVDVTNIEQLQSRLVNIERQLQSGMPDELLETPGGRRPFAQYELPEGQVDAAMERLAIEGEQITARLRSETGELGPLGSIAPGGGSEVTETMAKTKEFLGQTGPAPAEQVLRGGERVQRYVPKRGVRKRAANLIADPTAKAEITNMIRQGLDMGGRDWYNTEPLRDLFVTQWGEGKGDAMWRDFMTMIGETSPQTPVPQNIKAASYYRNLLWDPTEGGMISGDKLEEIIDRIRRVEEPPTGIGGEVEDVLGAGEGVLPVLGSGWGTKARKTQAEDIVSWLSSTYDDPDNFNKPKVRAFIKSLLGHDYSIAIDVHFMRSMGMLSGDPTAWMKPNWSVISADNLKQLGIPVNRDGTPSLRHGFLRKTEKIYKKKKEITYEINALQGLDGKALNLEDLQKIPSVFADAPSDTEYGALEEFINGIATELGIRGPQAQASLWLAMAERTGVKGGSRGTVMDIFRGIIADRALARGIPEEQVLHEFLTSGKAFSFLGAALGITAYQMGASPEEQAQETNEFSYGGGPTAGPRDLAAALGPPPGPGGQTTAFSDIQPQLMGV